MSLRSEARELAESTIHDLAKQGVAAAVALIERRIEWRWGTGAPLLALEAEHMVTMLTFGERGPLETRGMRKLRRGYWLNRWRRWAARAWAVDPAFAERCKICRPELIPT